MSWLVSSFQKSATETLRHRDNLTILHATASLFLFMLSVSVPLWPLFQAHRYSRILAIHLRVLTQQLFRLFRNHFRQSHLRFHKLIAARVRIAQARRAAPAQTKFLP